MANASHVTWRHAAPLCGAALVAVLASWALVPRSADAEPAQLESRIPTTFGPWRTLPDPTVQVALDTQQDRGAAVAATYDESLMRTYGDGQGHRVMVALAYGRNQRQEGKIHRPELCYVAQGSALDSSRPAVLASDLVPGHAIRIRRMVTRTRDQLELVSYWIRIGDTFPENAVESRLHILAEGLQGRVPDGILYRVSQVARTDLPPQAQGAVFDLQERFMLDLVQNMSPSQRSVLIG